LRTLREQQFGNGGSQAVREEKMLEEAFPGSNFIVPDGEESY